MHPACKLCKGACCRFIQLPCTVVPRDERQWLELHGTVDSKGQVSLDVPCRMLLADGRCAIQKTKPKMCSDFEVGGDDCLRAIRRQHTAAAAAEIEKRLG
jgi:hypothetical protein